MNPRTTCQLVVLVILVVLVGCTGEPESEPAAPPAASPAASEALRPATVVRLEGQPNFRDLGGHETVDGRRVKSGEVYRSGEFSHLTEEDVAALEELGLRTVVNFLLPEEIEKNGPDRLPESTTESLHPIAGERAAQQTMVVTAAMRSGEFEKVPPEINPEFHRLLTDEGRQQYAALLRKVADPANRPLAYHCSHGVHRTGTATAILLSALGVPWEIVREEYLLSNELREEEVQVQLARILQAVAESRGVPPEEVDMGNVEAFYVVQGFYIDGTLEQAVADYGSMEAYIREGLGITDHEIEILREQLLE